MVIFVTSESESICRLFQVVTGNHRNFKRPFKDMTWFFDLHPNIIEINKIFLCLISCYELLHGSSRTRIFLKYFYFYFIYFKSLDFIDLMLEALPVRPTCVDVIIRRVLL